VLSTSQPVEPLTGSIRLSTAAAAWLAAGSGLVPFPLAYGGTVWMMGSGSSGRLANRRQGSSPGTAASSQPVVGALLDHLPVASPMAGGFSLQDVGPSGYDPPQIQTAYGLSNGTA
jgi:hypothetical protein